MSQLSKSSLLWPSHLPSQSSLRRVRQCLCGACLFANLLLSFVRCRVCWLLPVPMQKGTLKALRPVSCKMCLQSVESTFLSFALLTVSRGGFGASLQESQLANHGSVLLGPGWHVNHANGLAIPWPFLRPVGLMGSFETEKGPGKRRGVETVRGPAGALNPLHVDPASVHVDRAMRCLQTNDVQLFAAPRDRYDRYG